MNRWLDVGEESGVGEARRAARRLSSELGLGPEATERASIVTTEAATNLLKHAGGGRILLAELPREGGSTLAVIAVDHGDGIANPDRMMEDGASSVGSMGTGLGAMRRLSDAFDVYTGPAQGTVLTMEIGTRSGRSAIGTAPVDVVGLRLNHPGEGVCGDAFAVRSSAGSTDLLICDGLGHGPKASDAANAVVTAFHASQPEADVAGRLRHSSVAAQPTRGAVGVVCSIRLAAEELASAGVGNASALVVRGGTVRRLPSREGRLGSPEARPYADRVPFGDGDTLILHTDGLKTLRDLDRRQGLLFRKPLTIAALLLRDDVRGTDDACVVVARRRSAGGARR